MSTLLPILPECQNNNERYSSQILMDDHGQAVAIEVGKKTTTCPILKKEAAATTLTTQSEGGGGGKGMKKHVEWDEHAIEEHDLLRGTRMKVSKKNPMMMMMIC